MSNSIYTPMAGEDITTSLENAVTIAQERGKNVHLWFNDDFIVVSPRTSPAKRLKRWDRETEKAREAYRKSPSAVLRERAEVIEAAKHQVQINALIAILPDILATGGMNAVMQWLEDFTPLADSIRVKFDAVSILELFKAAGYGVNAHVGQPVKWFNTRERYGEWVIGQAMSFFAKGWGPHPMTVIECQRYFVFTEPNKFPCLKCGNDLNEHTCETWEIWPGWVCRCGAVFTADNRQGHNLREIKPPLNLEGGDVK